MRFICRRQQSETRPNGVFAIFEVTDELLDRCLSLCSKKGSEASKIAKKMVLDQGGKILERGTSGTEWFFTQAPLRFVPHPTKCDLSGKLLEDIMYDGKTSRGWAVMSEQSWSTFGCGQLGSGAGQKYRRGTDGKFYLSEGMLVSPQPIKG